MSEVVDSPVESNAGGSEAVAFDPDQLREKYRQERDKRLRADGNDQYVEVADQFERFEDDPFVTRIINREPLTDDVEVIIVGGGFGGLLTGAHLRKAGIEGIRFVEKGADFGGTWYWNRYPGAQCDVESYIYMPLLEEVGYIPKEKYAFGDEILDYTHSLATKYDLYRDACFQTGVIETKWDDEAQMWLVSTDRGDLMRARYIVQSIGVLNKPKLPGVQGLDSFKGHTFHTSRWDYVYTGGGPNGDLTELRDKRVGVIGTGASAIQSVPHLAEAAQHLFVFQRTPSSVDIRGNRPTDPEWVKSLSEGWQEKRRSNFNILVGGGYQEEDLVHDNWTEIISKLRAYRPADGNSEVTPEEAGRAAEMADFEKMEGIRARVDSIVDNKATAEALKPYYRQFCKRPCCHDGYLPAFNRPSVTLVNTDGKGVAKITENAVVVDGQAYEVDCLIFASGFEVGTNYARRAGFETIGRDGEKISDKWADGAKTFYGFQSRGFPNAFFMGMTQTGLTPNFTHMLQEQAQVIAYVIAECAGRGAATVETSVAAEAEWQAEMQRMALASKDFFEACTPGYYNNEGRVNESGGIQSAAYGGGSEAFFRIIREWREAGKLDGLEIS